MTFRRWLASCLCVISALASLTAQAISLSEPSHLIQAANERGLATHPVWLKLLHYDRDGKRSEVISPDFFLAPNGAINSAAELEATVRAYFLPWEGETDQHPRCRFPARYFWLAQQINLPGFQLRDSRCRRLERWALFDRVRSVSVLLISGYYGNPASTFGHVLIKLNTDALDDQAGLFDLSLNFGALVPENEPTVLYVARGLAGGYEAGFSDRYFYTQDLVYARTELRDIWDYRLQLPDNARTLLVLHIWEIVGKKYRYYFLTKNCAYRLAGLLELATGETFLNATRLWYLPVELFHRLIDIDADRRAKQVVPLIQSVRFVPSNQRKLYHEFSGLAPSEMSAANKIIASGAQGIPSALADIETERQIPVLDAALAYFEYRLIAEEPKPSPTARQAKDRVLLERLRLPISQDAKSVPPTLRSPADAPRPLRLGLGIGFDKHGNEEAVLYGAPFVHEISEPNDALSDELAVLDLRLALRDKRSVVNRFDAIRVRKFITERTEIIGEHNVSWQFRIGAQRISDDAKPHTDGVISYGMGYAWYLSDGFGVYVMTDLAGHTASPNARVSPHLGVSGVSGRWRGALQWGAENADDAKGWRSLWSGNAQYLINTNHGLRIDIGNETTTRSAISLFWRW